MNEESSEIFKSLCNELLRSETVEGYDFAKALIEESDDRKFLKTWISWWHDRRGFIFRALAPKNAPPMSQAETVHASWADQDPANMTLLDVCMADVRDTIVTDVELEGYKNGTGKAGNRGPS